MTTDQRITHIEYADPGDEQGKPDPWDLHPVLDSLASGQISTRKAMELIAQWERGDPFDEYAPAAWPMEFGGVAYLDGDQIPHVLFDMIGNHDLEEYGRLVARCRVSNNGVRCRVTIEEG